MLSAAILLTLASGAAGQVAPAQVRPTFACAGQLASTEAAICADEELAAHDRAMGLIYRHLKNDKFFSLADQRRWIAKRNGCGANRGCILHAYSGWIGGHGIQTRLGRHFSRVDPSHGQEPGDLYVQPLGNGWALLSVTTLYVMDARTGGVNDDEVAGVVRFVHGTATWSDGRCRLKISSTARGGWILGDDNNTCEGGLNTTLAGEYR